MSRKLHISASVLAAVIFWFGMQAQLQYLWWRWTSSGLRSIGMLLPLASLYFCWRAWHEASAGAGPNRAPARPVSGWNFRIFIQKLAGITGWALMLAALAAARWSHLPVGLLIWLYASGAVILLGGWAAWRAAWFGLLLLLLLNPVPLFLTALLDARLQSWAVRAAAALARGLGMAPRRRGFSLDFANGETMYIAASCNGLRSATAMLYLALIAGYWRHWPWRRMALLLAAALGLAYALNFFRLGGLVLFHDLAGRWPAISNYEPQVDHGLGGLTFFAGALGLGYWIVRYKNPGSAAICHDAAGAEAPAAPRP